MPAFSRNTQLTSKTDGRPATVILPQSGARLAIYLINMDRAPERLQAMQDKLGALGLGFHRIAGVDGRALDFPFPNSANGAIACSMAAAAARPRSVAILAISGPRRPSWQATPIWR